MQTKQINPSILNKIKIIPVLMSIPLGPFVWLYTYEQNKTRFWVGSILQYLFVVALIVLIIIIAFNAQGALEVDDQATGSEIIESLNDYLVWIFVILAGLLSLRIWAFIDRLVKPSSWYMNYPRRPLSKTRAVIFSIFFSYAAWLYTYEKDSKKFWIAFGANTLATMIDNAVDTSIGSFIALGILAWAIIDVSIKHSNWYTNYPNYQKPEAVSGDMTNLPPSN